MVEPSCILSEHVVAIPTSRLVLSTVFSCASATVLVGILHHYVTSLIEPPTATEHGFQHHCSRGCLLWCMGLTIFVELLMLHHFMCRRVVQEIVRPLQGVGIVLESRSLVGNIISSQFVDEANIAGVIINEGLTTTDVHYYLAFMLHNRDSMAVAFQNLLPDLATILPVYQAIMNQHKATAEIKVAASPVLEAKRP